MEQHLYPRRERRAVGNDAVSALEAQVKLYKLAQVGEMLQVSIPTLRTWQHRGLLNVVRLPGGTLRVSEDEVARIMAGAGRMEKE